MTFPKVISELFNDNLSGSEALLERLNIIFIENENFLCNDSLLNQIKNKFSDFALITNHLSQIIKQESSERKSFIENKISVSKSRFHLLYQNFTKEFRPKAPITISNSFTIQKIFEKYKSDGNDFSLTICESRPMFEGGILAENLAKSGIKINLITEAQMAHFMDESDCAIIGADKILKNGNVINKVGSRILAISAKHFNKPFYVISSKNKKVNTNIFEESEKEKTEIYSCKNNMIKITNKYFEEIESTYITKIITD